MSISAWLKPRLRLWAIYNELGYIPWHKPRKPRKPRKARKQRDGVYMGTREAIIPFLNNDTKRTFAHLLLRPGYMMRDYILRGQHERYLAPFTALLVFYSVFTLIVAVVNPETARSSLADKLINEFDTLKVEVDSVANTKAMDKANSILLTMRQTFLLTRYDMHPEEVNAPWKASVAAVEGALRSKGIPLFLGNFLLLWMTLAWALRKQGINLSGAAAASAYVLCQFCIFMFLALLLSLGRNTDLGMLLMAVLLYIDYRQLLGVGRKQAIKLIIRTGLACLLILVVFYVLLFTGMAVVGALRA